MQLRWLSFWCLLAATMLLLKAATLPPPTDTVQKEFDRCLDLISPMMYGNGRDTNIITKPYASDEILIIAAAQQLNQIPAPLKTWHILKKQRVGQNEFRAHLLKQHPELFQSGISAGEDDRKFLVAIIDSDHGHKVIIIDQSKGPPGMPWARMYNCDANFSSTQSGGTPLDR